MPERDDYLDRYTSVKSIVSEALPFELVCTIGGVFAGIILVKMIDAIEMIPGLLVLAIHLGLISRIERNPELINNVAGSLTLSLIMSVVLGILAHLVTVALGMTSVGVVVLVSIAVFAGMSSGLILAVIAVVITIGAFRHGIDPDNITTPALGTLGDVITMFMLFCAAEAVIWIWHITP